MASRTSMTPRERILAAIELDGEPCQLPDIHRWAGMSHELVNSTVDEMVNEGLLTYQEPQPHRVVQGERYGGFRIVR